jgi:hypothetical protein
VSAWREVIGTLVKLRNAMLGCRGSGVSVVRVNDRVWARRTRRATSVSRTARAAPGQKCGPKPRERWRFAEDRLHVGVPEDGEDREPRVREDGRLPPGARV